MGQSDQRRQFAQVGNAVEDAHLDGPQMRRRPDIPTDFVDVVDDAGGLLVVHKPLELPPRLELERQPAVGSCWNIIARLLAYPVSSPAQNGEDADSASRCG